MFLEQISRNRQSSSSLAPHRIKLPVSYSSFINLTVTGLHISVYLPLRMDEFKAICDFCNDLPGLRHPYLWRHWPCKLRKFALELHWPSPINIIIKINIAKLHVDIII